MTEQTLDTIAQAMVADGKGILAADEGTGTIKKRFDTIDVESTEDSRRSYRNLLFSTAGAAEFISGVIMFDETIRQSSADGTPFPELLSRQGILTGIKVDGGAKPLAGCPGELVTAGLDGLRERLAEYFGLGARFAKWRALHMIGDGMPSRTAIAADAHALARYAARSQEAGLVPIVEPEVLMDGSHTIERCREALGEILSVVFQELRLQRVCLEGIVLKPSMVTAGSACPQQAAIAQAAEETVQTMRRHVPAAVPGIAFLSGGQSEEVATEHLNAMNALGPYPWQLSFSYGRALQQSALQAWLGKPENAAAAQAAYLHRARMNGLARRGAYQPDLEKELAA